MIELKGMIYTTEGSRIATEEDDKTFAEALKRGEVKTFYEAVCKPLNKWKREQTNTPVKAKKYRREMEKFLTGKETVMPAIQKMRRITKKRIWQTTNDW